MDIKQTLMRSEKRHISSLACSFLFFKRLVIADVLNENLMPHPQDDDGGQETTSQTANQSRIIFSAQPPCEWIKAAAPRVTMVEKNKLAEGAIPSR